MAPLLKPLTDKVFDSLFKTYKKEAFRLETLPEYRVEAEKSEVEYFCKYKRLRNPHPSPWHKMVIGEGAKRGAKMWRIRRLSKKITDYERWEVERYKVAAPFGLKVWAFTRDFTDMPELNALPFALEYWMFDEKTVVLIQYDLVGHYLCSYQYTGNIRPYIALRNKLKKLSKRIV